LKKNNSQVKMGSAGKKNCLVIGIKSASMSADAAPVLRRGPGAWLTEREKMAMMISMRYCPS